MRLAFSILFILVFSKATIAEQIKDTAIQSNFQQDKIQSSLTSSSGKDLYKLLYENSTDSNAKLVSTMQWSIGIISTFIIVLLGSQILFNYRVSKNEVRLIRSELEEEFSNLKANLQSDVHKERQVFTEKLEDKLSTLRIEIKDSISMHYGEKDKYIHAKLESFDKDIMRLTNELDIVLKEFKIDLSKLEGDVWQIRGVASNALVRYIKSINLRIEKGFDVRHLLDDVIEILPKMTRISVENMASLVTTVGKLPEVFQDKKLIIESLYSAMPQYIYVDDPSNPGYLKIVDV